MLVERAPAKINLTLAVVGRRADGYHLLESFVAFAGDAFDELTLTPDAPLSLSLDGATSVDAGGPDDNLVLKAARALAERRKDLRLGAFALTKSLPVAAGLGGGSADAAAALRLLARLNNILLDDPVLFQAAQEIGADVPVCLASRARMMRGIGDELGPMLGAPELFALLVNPHAACPTGAVFKELDFQADRHSGASRSEEPGTQKAEPFEPQRWGALKRQLGSGLAADAAPRNDNLEKSRSTDEGGEPIATSANLNWLLSQSNDLEAPAIRLVPVIADVLAALRALDDCKIARMSGSGATCFALFEARDKAERANEILRRAHPDWWIAATSLQ